MKFLLLLFVVSCGPPINTLKECKGRFSVANNRADSAAIAANSSACAWYLGSEWRYK